MNLSLILPYLCLIITAALCLVFYHKPILQAALSTVGSLSLVAMSVNLIIAIQKKGIQVLQLGNWQAPFGISLVADLTSGLMVFTASLIFFAFNIFSLKSIDEFRKKNGFYFLINVLMLGSISAFLTGDLFNLFVCFELLLISSFMLLTAGAKAEEIKHAIPYVVLNIIATFSFLVGIALIYGHTGNLNMAYLSTLLRESDWSYGVRTAAVFLFFTFAVKSAMFPLFFWLPRSYSAVPGIIGALFSALLTKVGVYSMLRVFTLIFPLARDSSLQNTLYYAALMTMIIGVLGAVAQNSIRRILAVHIISQVGYMLWGLSLFSPIALGSVLFFMIHNMIVKSNLFLISDIIERSEGTDTLSKLGGGIKKYPFLSSLFLVSSLSLAGLPPLSGFFAKLFLIKEALSLEDFYGTAVAFSVGLLTLFSMIKVWSEVFLKENNTSSLKAIVLDRQNLAPILFLSMFSILLGTLSGPIYEIFISAGESLYNPSAYVLAVLGIAGVK